MTTITNWRNTGPTRISLKQRLLGKNEFNFTNKFLWKLPCIHSKHKSISPVFSPSIRNDPRSSSIRKTIRSMISEEKGIEALPEVKMIESPINFEVPLLIVEGQQKIYTKHYFRKTFLNKSHVPKQTPARHHKVTSSNDTELDAWGMLS